MGRYEQALADFDKAIELDPSYDWAIAHRGETYRQMGRYEEALADFGKAIELDPSYHWAIASRGQTYLQMGRYEQALADLDKAIELDPSSGWVIAHRGEIYLQMGGHEQALADLDKAIELDPSNDWIQYLQSRTYLSLGQTSQAYTHLRNAADQVRKNIIHERAPSNDRYNLAVYLAAEGRFDEAKQALQDALAIYPKHSWALEFLNDLRDLARTPGVDSIKVHELIEFMNGSISKQTLR
jgi:tetratricopeptide (TPR) repeat protein